MDKPEKCLSCPFLDGNDECILQDNDKNFVADTWEKLYENCPINVQEVCEWIKYDYRTIVPREHDINNPYWRIPENMDKLKYCPYCGKEIKVID